MKRPSNKVRRMHVDFQSLLEYKERALVELFCDCREFVLQLYPDCNEILYHTHALTTVFSLSEKLSDAFCMIPIYTNHMNLGFNQGTRLEDPNGLLIGTGKLIRHIPIASPAEYRNEQVIDLLKSAVEVAMGDMKKPPRSVGQSISKIQ
ncbi:MAG: hypothetical protein ABL921_07680 [Pirellula sp.]